MLIVGCGDRGRYATSLRSRSLRPESDPITRNALILLAVIASAAALYWLRDIFTPLAMALFLAMMIDAFAQVLAQRAPGVSKRFALPVAIVTSLLAFTLAIWVIAKNAGDFFDQISDYSPKLDVMLQRVSTAMHLPELNSVDALMRQLNMTSYLGTIAQSLQSIVSEAVFVLIYLGFIIASRRLFGRKIVALFPNHRERAEATKVFEHVRNSVESYLWIQTLTGLMIAAGSWLAMALISDGKQMGLDNAVFWAFLIFIVSYVPILGGAVGIFLPALFALVQFDNYWPAFILVCVLQAINFVVGNVILPRMQGDSLNIDPVVVLLSLAFWGTLWGLTGMFLSTPLTVTVMVILAQFKGSHWIAVLLSDDGTPNGERSPRKS